MEPKLKTIYIVGPTASGKTALSIAVAKEINAEIICADSQTVRRMMDIATAKPTKQEMQGVPHHLIDLIDPYENFSVHDFQNRARKSISEIKKRKKHALVVGGTGLYVDSLYFSYSLPVMSSDFSKEELTSWSLDRLQQSIIDKGLPRPRNWENPRHLIGTLLRGDGLGGRSTPDPNSIIVGLYPGREALVTRIASRINSMFEAGLVEEVRTILCEYGDPPRAFDAIGYKIVMRHLNGEISLDQAKELFEIADRQYAKRQMSWFRRNPSIIWFSSPEEAKAYILERT